MKCKSGLFNKGGNKSELVARALTIKMMDRLEALERATAKSLAEQIEMNRLIEIKQLVLDGDAKNSNCKG